jgi:2-keto-myo-inositol isomerase
MERRMATKFALNHMVAPRRNLERFFEFAQQLGLHHVEIRNDLPGIAIEDGTAASAVKESAARRSLEIISINALQRFNDWSPERAAQAGSLIDYAAACGAKALVLCPVNDISFQPGKSERLAGLRTALDTLAPMLRRAGLTGLVEPLGFVECSLRSKREAVEAIDAVGAGEVFRLVHDTFHHFVAGEDEIYPERTGLVHLSGVEDSSVPVASLRDPHRVLVGPGDRLGNVDQVRALRAGGYQGLFSFEPFAESVAVARDLESEVAASIRYIEEQLAA